VGILVGDEFGEKSSCVGERTPGDSDEGKGGEGDPHLGPHRYYSPRHKKENAFRAVVSQIDCIL
jgi:hypothetical protein